MHSSKPTTSAHRFIQGEERREGEATSKEIPSDSKIATANVDNKRQIERKSDRHERNTFASWHIIIIILLRMSQFNRQTAILTTVFSFDRQCGQLRRVL